jgi:hypothetical protein
MISTPAGIGSSAWPTGYVHPLDPNTSITNAKPEATMHSPALRQTSRRRPFRRAGYAAAAAAALLLAVGACSSSSSGTGASGSSAGAGASAIPAPSTGVEANGTAIGLSQFIAKQDPLPPAKAATGTPIKVAFPYADWAALAKVGLLINYRTDDPQQAAALVKYVNAHGGFDGHPIVADPLKVNIADANQAQAACLTFTSDHHDFTVLDVTVYIENTQQAANCISGTHKTPLTGIYPGSAANIGSQFPYKTSPVPNQNQDAVDLVLGGYKDGFFKSGPGKVGILRNGCDDPSVWNGPTGVNSLLDLIGVPASDRSEFTLRCSTASDPSEIPAALLQFKEAGVDKIISAESGTGAGSMMQLESRQNYHPVWLFSDLDASILNSTSDPKAEMNGAYGVSSAVQVYSTSPNVKVCNDIYTSAGLAPIMAPQRDLVAVYLCETTLDAMQIADKVKGPLTQASYAAASVNAGWLFSAQTWGIDYTGKNLNGGSLTGLLRYNSQQGAWELSSQGVVSAPHECTSTFSLSGGNLMCGSQPLS